MLAKTAVWLGLVLISLAAPKPALAADASDCFAQPACPERDAIVAAYGLEPAERVRAEGVTTVRAFFLDAWRRGEPAVVFSQSPGAAPRLRVVTFGRDGLRPQTIQDRPAPLTAWREVQSAADIVAATAPASAYASFREAPDANGEVEEDLCFDPHWVAVEVISSAGVVRRDRTVCFGDPVVEAAWSIGEAAVAISPGCPGLDKGTWNSPFTRLALCRWMRGNLSAAAQVRNMAGQAVFNAAPNEPESEAIGQWFEPAAVLKWENHRAEGRDQIAALWRQMITADSINFYYSDFDGKTADRVLVTGLVSKWHEGRPDESAAFEATWIRQSGGSWRIRDWTVESFAKDKPL